MSDAPNTVEQTGTAATSTPAAKGLGTAVLWVVVAVVILGVGYLVARGWGSDKGAGTAATAAQATPESMVASVNGVSITRAELDRKIQQVKNVAPTGATDPTQDAGFELNLLNEVINLKLLTTAAEAKGHVVTDAEIQKELDTLVTTVGGKEAFDQQVQKAGLTEDELRTNMRNELLIRKLLDADTDLKNVTASDSEIKSLYDQAVASTPDAPPLAQVTEILRAQIIQQKSKQIVDTYIAKLRTESKVDITL